MNPALNEEVTMLRSSTFPTRFDNERDRHVIETLWRKDSFPVLLGSIVILLLQLQTIPIPLDVQVMPISSLLAFVFLPFFLREMKPSPLLTAVITFFLFTLVHSSAGLLIDLLSGKPDIRALAWFRQLSALIQGVAVYLVLRSSLLYMSNSRVAQLIVWGAVPALAVALLTILWGSTGNEAAGSMVKGIRWMIAPLGYTSAFRASGLALEPSTFAAVIAVLLVPIILYRANLGKMRKGFHLFIACTVLSFAWTFSLTGVLILLPVLIFGVFHGIRRRLLLGLTSSLLILVAAILIIVPNNQMIRHVEALLFGKSTVSFTDRYFSTVGPWMRIFDSYTFIGYGLGGSATHFMEMIPEQAAKDILEGRWKEMPNLGTLTGRVAAETGMIGFTLFCFLIYIAFRESRQTMLAATSADMKNFVASARLGFVGVLVGLSITFGSFHYPYLWFWIAVLDSRYFLVQSNSVEQRRDSLTP